MTDTNSAPAKGGGLAVAALVLGIVAIVFSFIPLVGIFLIWAPAAVAVILGIIALVGARPRKVMAIIGLALAVVGVIIAIVSSVIAAAAISAGIEAANESTSITGEEAAGETSAVNYSVTGDGGTASISYWTYDNGNSGMESANGAPLPWSKDLTITNEGGIFDFTSMSMTAMGNDTTTTITCTITVDGEVVSTQTSTGAYAMVSCSVSG